MMDKISVASSYVQCVDMHDETDPGLLERVLIHYSELVSVQCAIMVRPVQLKV